MYKKSCVGQNLESAKKNTHACSRWPECPTKWVEDLHSRRDYQFQTTTRRLHAGRWTLDCINLFTFLDDTRCNRFNGSSIWCTLIASAPWMQRAIPKGSSTIRAYQIPPNSPRSGSCYSADAALNTAKYYCEPLTTRREMSCRALLPWIFVNCS